jgi:hypothetical protein
MSTAPDRSCDGQQTTDQLRHDLAELARSCEAYEKKLDWFNADRLWATPSVLTKATQTIAAIVGSICWPVPPETIAVADKMRQPFGVLPIAVTLSAELEMPLVIWKEQVLPGDVPSVFPAKSSTRHGPLLIIQDAIERGTVVQKMLIDLSSRGHGDLSVAGVIALFARSSDRTTVVSEIVRREAKCSVRVEILLTSADFR